MLSSTEPAGSGVSTTRRPHKEGGGLNKVVPYRVESVLISQDTWFSKVKDWGVNTVADGQLITDQDPGSSGEAADTLVTALRQARVRAA